MRKAVLNDRNDRNYIFLLIYYALFFLCTSNKKDRIGFFFRYKGCLFSEVSHSIFNDSLKKKYFNF